jgi:hypothetical protein
MGSKETPPGHLRPRLFLDAKSEALTLVGFKP